MAEIFQFKPKATLTATENLEAFIAKCRDELTVFGANLNWKSPVWPKIAVFAKLGVTTRKPLPQEVLDPEFIDFAKAYCRYQQGHSFTRAKNEGMALRAVEAALLQVTRSADIGDLSITVLDEAAELAKQHYSTRVAYQCGREIERLAKFLTENKLVSCDVQNWLNPIRRAEDNNKTGKEAGRDRTLLMKFEQADRL